MEHHSAQKQGNTSHRSSPAMTMPAELSESAMSSSLLNQPGPSAALSPAAPVPLPPIALPRLDAQACRLGEKGWRNIPEAVREALAQLTDTVSALHTTNNNIALAVNRRAGHAECMQALAGRASQEQLQALTRYLQRDLLPRLEQPCTGHASAARVVSGLQGRVTQLEAVIQTQDAALRQLQRELSVARTESAQALAQSQAAAASAAQRREQDEADDAQFVTRAELQAMLMQIREGSSDISTRGGGAVSSGRPGVGGSAATGAAHEGGYVSPAVLHTKADSTVVQALSNDVEMLAESLADMKQQLQAVAAARAEPAGYSACGKRSGTGSEEDVLVNVNTRLFNAEKKLSELLGAHHSLESSLEHRLPAALTAGKLQEVVESFEGVRSVAEKVEGLDDSLRVVQARVTQLSVAQATAAIADATAAGPGGSGSEAGRNGPAGKAAIMAAVEQALRPKIAVLSTSMQQQAQSNKESLQKELEARVASVREEMGKEAKSRMNALRLEVGKQLHAKAGVTPEQIQQLLGTEAENLHRQMTARLSGAMSELRGEISSVRTLALETALQAQGGGTRAGGAAGSGDAGAQGAGLPLAELSGRVDALQQTVSMSEARLLARLESVQSSERRLGESLHAQVEVAVGALQSQMAALEARQQDVAHAQSKSTSVDAAVVSLQAQVQELLEKQRALQAAQQQVAVQATPAPAPVLPAGQSSITGRWVWKNRRLTPWSDDAQVSGRCVMWDVQSVNSAADLLLWSATGSAAGGGITSKDGKVLEGSDAAATVVAVKSGLYRVSLGFFALILPSLTLCVDGQPVLTTGPPQDCMVPGPGLLGAQPADEEAESVTESLEGRKGRVRFSAASSKKRGSGQAVLARGVRGDRGEDADSQDSSLDTTALLEGAATSPALLSGVQVGGAGPVLHKHPAGCVAGVTCTHYLALPARAKLTVRYAGKAKGQGFLELAKL